MITVRKVSVLDLDTLDYDLCYEHNLHGGGHMQSQLWRCRETPEMTGDAYAYIAEDENDFLGWALSFLDHASGFQKTTTYFFTRPEYRRCGVGTLLAEHVKRDEPLTQVVGWDDTSRAFFAVTFEVSA